MYSRLELEYLSRPENHRIHYDGHDYWWQVNKGDGFENQYNGEENTDKLYHYIKFWIPKFAKMLKEMDSQSIIDSISTSLEQANLLKEAYTIARASYSPKKTIASIRELIPGITPGEVISITGISKRTVYNNFK